MSKDESALWRHVMDDVEPLPDGGGDAPAPETGPEIPVPGEAGKPPKTPPRMRMPMPSPGPLPGTHQEPELRHGEAPGLEKRTKIRMRRGRMDIEATLDLHGMTQEQAHRALGAFLHGSRSAGKRTVLVITGKGGGRDVDSGRGGPGGATGRGVLRDAVPRWLNEGPNRRMIRGFSFAGPKDGGEGALYVLLKRVR
ncbi:MAG: Smr/MutS family protein [Proteobacteria bacterium]|nr:Smr/MutS family protein [Pseudomonadota bacterium]